MVSNFGSLREDAQSIWRSAVDAVLPEKLLSSALASGSTLRAVLTAAPRIVVVGAGKAGATMASAVEDALPELLPRMVGVVNVPNESVRSLRAIRLHGSRPAGTNSPTEAGVQGANEILQLCREVGPDDICLCLLSGGGSALLPAPSPEITLTDKQLTTKLLHACGATINEMNAVRKHLSAIKGGRLVQAFRGKAIYSLIVSDVVGDPLDVIASGPTAADPTTFADVMQILHKYDLTAKVPARVLGYLQKGADGQVPETLKTLPSHVHNLVLGNNVKALSAAQQTAEKLGYRVINLGSFIEGETRHVAVALAGVVRSIREQQIPYTPPVCLLSGGETTVTLCANAGRGGRNQEFVLASLLHVAKQGLDGLVVLSGGTDGEDGPTDAAGALADAQTLSNAGRLGLNAQRFLDSNDAYTFFDATGDLLRTGLTGTNVMDVRVTLLR